MAFYKMRVCYFRGKAEANIHCEKGIFWNHSQITLLCKNPVETE